MKAWSRFCIEPRRSAARQKYEQTRQYDPNTN